LGSQQAITDYTASLLTYMKVRINRSASERCIEYICDGSTVYSVSYS
jgi:hypothetical protein